MKTAEQRLAEIERKRAYLLQKLKGEEARKAAKVGQYVREHLPGIEQRPEFLAWLSTDIDRALFGVAVTKEKKKGGDGQVSKLTSDKSSTDVQSISGHQVEKSTVADFAERFNQVGKRTEPVIETGGAGDAIRRRMAQSI